MEDTNKPIKRIIHYEDIAILTLAYQFYKTIITKYKDLRPKLTLTQNSDNSIPLSAIENNPDNK